MAKSSKIVKPAARVIEPNEVKPDSYYWALFAGDPEIILTTHNATHFYLHGDEHTREINSPLLVVKQLIGSRAEMVERIRKNKA